MFGKTQRGSAVSRIVLALALLLTALLPNIAAGGPPSGDAAARVPAAPLPAGTPASFLDTTVADFGAGTLDKNGYISETTDGEVILAPAFGAEFSGDSLPAGMSSSQFFPPNGTAVVAGGRLTLDGARAGTDALFGPGRSLEFSASQNMGALNVSGFAVNSTAAPSASFRTGVFPTNLIASTNDGTMQNDNLGLTYFNAFHRYRIDWGTSSLTYSIDGAPVATHSNSPTADMRPLFGDVFNGGKVQVVDWVRLTPYADTSEFLSRVLDATETSHWQDLIAETETPDGTAIVIETRSGDSAVPDATWSPWQGPSGNAIVSPDGRYLQYRALLSTTDAAQTPALRSVTIHYLAGCTAEICNGLDDNCDGQVDEGEALCDDHNPCTTDACVDGQCQHKPTAGAECSDGNPCTTGDACNADGQCAGSPVVCDDHNPCTSDSCAEGQCVFKPTPGAECSDGDACTSGDACDAEGRCLGRPVVCNDENPCTSDACVDGACVFTPTLGAPCDDGNPCTQDDACAPAVGLGSVCRGTPLSCDDGNPCTRDACDPATGLCQHEITPGVTCDDGDPCTRGDLCVENPSGGADCTGNLVDCDDQNPCTLDRCNPQTGECEHKPIDCDDQNPCTADRCNPDTGQCQHAAVSCDDNNPCTFDGCDPATRECEHRPNDCDDQNPCTRDVCNLETGQCEHTGPQCDDGNPCTQDSCDPATGECAHDPTPGQSCDDGNTCTRDDVCVQGAQGIACQGTAVDCDDKNPCTSDTCEAAGCVAPDNGHGTATLPPQACGYSTDNSFAIIDGLPAGTSLVIPGTLKSLSCPSSQGACSFAPPTPGVDCDQAGGTLGGEQECAAATLELNLSGTGALTGFNRTISIPVGFEAQAAARTPGDPVQSFSTLMFTFQGQIVGDPDFDLLRITGGDAFGLPSPGHTTLTQQTDGSWSVDSYFDLTYRIDFVGTIGGAVSGMSGSTTGTARIRTAPGGCVHTPLDCDDKDPCTTDRCDPETGQCEHQAVSCDDQNACTRDSCDPATGQCVHEPTPGAPCDDGDACTTDDKCVETPAGTACHGSPVACDDNNPCTRDACDPSTGQCEHRPVDCDDQNPCTLDRCNPETGQCEHKPVICDDGNACTRDSCDPASGECVHTPDPGAACDDGNACTREDVCVPNTPDGIACQGTPVSCDDQNPCTKDSCDPATGLCVHEPSAGSACDDGNPCTADDRCVETAAGGAGCQGTPVGCDDNDPCSLDRCNPDTGQCEHRPVDCDDQSPCTIDRCNPQTGQCEHKPLSCDDGNACTRDSCDPASGECVHAPDPGAACDDGNACTQEDRCDDTGRCGGQTISCDDGNPCTDDLCTASAGCVHVNNSAPCDDGNACTSGDTCNEGQCRGGGAISCDDGNACTVDSCDPKDGCRHVGQAVFQTVCGMNPGTLNLNAQGSSFSVSLSIVDSCNPGSPAPVPAGSIGIVHVSRAGGIVLPDPSSLSCPAGDGGTAFETGLFEDLAARSVSGGGLSLDFDTPSDGSCLTRDGNRQDLSAVLSGVPDGTSAPICVAGTAGGQSFECCTSVRVLNKGNRR